MFSAAAFSEAALFHSTFFVVAAHLVPQSFNFDFHGNALVTYWERICIGNALETHWGRIGDALGTHWERTGEALGCFGDALGTHWDASRCIGDAFGT